MSMEEVEHATWNNADHAFIEIFFMRMYLKRRTRRFIVRLRPETKTRPPLGVRLLKYYRQSGIVLIDTELVNIFISDLFPEIRNTVIIQIRLFLPEQRGRM